MRRSPSQKETTSEHQWTRIGSRVSGLDSSVAEQGLVRAEVVGARLEIARPYSYCNDVDPCFPDKDFTLRAALPVKDSLGGPRLAKERRGRSPEWFPLRNSDHCSAWKEQLIFTEANEGNQERGDGREIGGAISLTCWVPPIWLEFSGSPSSFVHFVSFCKSELPPLG